MSRWFHASIAAVCAGGVGACSLAELSRDFGDVTANADGGDAGTSDGAPAGKSFCGSQKTASSLCDDFDEGTSLGLWEPPTILFGGALRIDTGDALSAPGSLLVSVPDSTTDAPIAYLTKKITRTVDGATLTFAIKADDVTGKTERAPAATITAETTAGQRQIRLVLAGPPFISELFLKPDGSILSSKRLDFSTPFQSNRWTTVEMAVTFTGTPHVSVRLDGGLLALDTDLDAGWAAARATATLGVEYAVTPTKAFDIRFDNVIFDPL